MTDEIQPNLLTNTQYKFEIHSLPHVTYHSQTVLLPSIQSDTPQFATARTQMPLPGSQVNFDPFTLTFLIDDDMKNYIELNRWFVRMMTKEPAKELVSDATLHVLNGNLTQQGIRWRFVNCFPSYLSELPFESSSPDNIPIQATVTFSYAYFTLGDEQL